MTDNFIGYYQKELNYLKNEGTNFARKHPKIAKQLELSSGESSDPHVERLMESFAFLTAKINQSIDDRFPEAAAALLNILYPNLINPMPAMGICQFQIDPDKAKIGSGYTIKARTPLFTKSDDGMICKFCTVYPVNVLPIKLTSANFISGNQYNLSSINGYNSWYLSLKFYISAPNLNLETLQIYLNMDTYKKHLIYENIFANSVSNNTLLLEQGKIHVLQQNAITAVGLGRDEIALPIADHTTHINYLLQEYFHFPDKFMFFNINQLSNVSSKQFEVLIPLSSPQEIVHYNIKAEEFLLGCSPIINLFPKVTDPFKLDYTKVQYHLVPDQRRDKTTEIFSIESMYIINKELNTTQEIAPYFSFHSNAKKSNVFWIHKRVDASTRDIPGTDILVSFVDLQFNPQAIADQVIYANTLCTNRFLAEQLPANAELYIEEKLPLTKIICLGRPVPQTYSPANGEALWLMISQLTVNHLVMNSGQESLKFLKELLNLYSRPYSQNNNFDLDNFVKLDCKTGVRRFGKEPWRGFTKGFELTLSLNNNQQVGYSSFLLGIILQYYFASNTPINSFTQLSIKDLATNKIISSPFLLAGAQIFFSNKEI